MHYHSSFWSGQANQAVLRLRRLLTGAPPSSGHVRQYAGQALGAFWFGAAVLLVAGGWVPVTSSTVDVGVNRSSTAMAGPVECPTLPGGLRPPGVESGSLVSAIAADIDGDGDLDVVATDRSLRLAVWTNDGSGHLTRQAPRQTPTVWQSAPDSPTLDARVRAALAFVQRDLPAVDPHVQGLIAQPHTGRLTGGRPRDIVDRLLDRSHAPRAPPL